MKISNSDIIKSGERDLIDSITGDLDWEAIDKIFKEKHGLSLSDDVEFKNGDMVIHNGQIAYKLDFDVKVTLSVLSDRKGECLGLSTSDVSPGNSEEEVTSNIQDTESENLKEQIDEAEEQDIDEIGMSVEEGIGIEPKGNIEQMASDIAEMISDINKD